MYAPLIWLAGLFGLSGLGVLLGILLAGPGWFILAGNAVLAVWNALPAWLKKLTLTLLVLAIVLAASYYRGIHDGREYIQAKWDAANAAAVQNAREQGTNTNAAAEASVPPLTPQDRAADAAVVPRVAPCRVPDPFDRSCAGAH